VLENSQSVLAIVQALPPDVLQQYVDWPAFLSEIFSAADLPSHVKSKAQVAQEQSAQANADAMRQAAVQAAGQAPQGVQ
jgi:hypothetical protein